MTLSPEKWGQGPGCKNIATAVLFDFQSRHLNKGNLKDALAGLKDGATSLELSLLGIVKPEQFVDDILLPALTQAREQSATGLYIQRLPGAVKKWKTEYRKRNPVIWSVKEDAEISLHWTIGNHKPMENDTAEDNLTLLLSLIATPGEICTVLNNFSPEQNKLPGANLLTITRYAKALNIKAGRAIKQTDNKTINTLWKGVIDPRVANYFSLVTHDTSMVRENLEQGIITLASARNDVRLAGIKNPAIISFGLTIDGGFAARMAEITGTRLNTSSDPDPIYQELRKIPREQIYLSAWQEICGTLTDRVTNPKQLGQMVRLFYDFIINKEQGSADTAAEVFGEMAHATVNILFRRGINNEAIDHKEASLLSRQLLQMYNQLPADNMNPNRLTREHFISTAASLADIYPELKDDKTLQQLIEKAYDKYADDVNARNYAFPPSNLNSRRNEHEAIQFLTNYKSF